MAAPGNFVTKALAVCGAILVRKQATVGVAGGGQTSQLIVQGASVFAGTAVTRAAVRAEVGDGPAIGSLYLSSGASGARFYLKVASAAASTDWQAVTTTAAD